MSSAGTFELGKNGAEVLHALMKYPCALTVDELRAVTDLPKREIRHHLRRFIEVGLLVKHPTAPGGPLFGFADNVPLRLWQDVIVPTLNAEGVPLQLKLCYLPQECAQGHPVVDVDEWGRRLCGGAHPGPGPRKLVALGIDGRDALIIREVIPQRNTQKRQRRRRRSSPPWRNLGTTSKRA